MLARFCVPTGHPDDGNLESIRARGAVGDICGSHFARDGPQVRLEMNGRTVAIGFEEMRAIPDRVGVSGGPGKALANIGAGILKNEDATTGLDARLDSGGPSC